MLMHNDTAPGYQPLMLLRNVSYPNFQLYCVAGKGVMPEKVLRIAILETYKWLRQRFRAFELPQELIWPDPELWDSVDINDFRSFRIDVGYILEVVWLPAEKIWALQLTEPDMGTQPGAISQPRPPVPGRLFDTSIAYRIVENQVECGFCTTVSEPVGTTADCEVFRLAFIKYLARNPQVGLWHNWQMTDNYHMLESIDNIKALGKWIRSNERMLPIVLVVEYRNNRKTSSLPEYKNKTDRYSGCTFRDEASIVTGPFSEQILPAHLNIPDRLPVKNMYFCDPYARLDFIDKEMTDDKVAISATTTYDYKAALSAGITSEEAVCCGDNDINQEKEGLLPFDLSNLTRYRMGYAQFFVLPVRHINDFCIQTESRIDEGDVIIFEPETFGGGIQRYEYRQFQSDTKAFCSKLEELIQYYPRKKPMTFGDVIFLPEAKAIERDKLLNTIRSKEEMLNYAEGKQHDIEDRHKREISILQGHCDDKDREINRRAIEREKVEERVKRLEKSLENQENEYKKKIADMEAEINRLNSLQFRPSHPKEVAGWVESQFEGRLIFHKRAQELMNDVAPNTIDLKILCDGLEYLATDYRDELIGNIRKDERDSNCQNKYGRPFNVTPVKGISPKMYPSEYKIKYYTGYKGKPVESPLDLHLTYGNSGEKMIRIYFLYDKEKRLIVVGSLPKHLSTDS